MTDDPTPVWASAKAAFLAVPVLGTALWGGQGGVRRSVGHRTGRRAHPPPRQILKMVWLSLFLASMR